VPRASADDHQAVADAIVGGDAALAGTLMRELIQGALELLLKAGNHPPRP
jgi:DNA-binding GntR family transcriptional regulator